MTGASPSNVSRQYRAALARAAERSMRPIERPDQDLLVRTGKPTQQQIVKYGDIVSIGRVSFDQEMAGLSLRRPRELTMTIAVIVSVFRPGSDGDLDETNLEEVTNLRAGELLDALEYEVRITDTTLEQTVRECFCVRGEIDESDVESNKGRSAFAVGEFTAKARIT